MNPHAKVQGLMGRTALRTLLTAAFVFAISGLTVLAQDTQYPARGQQIQTEQHHFQCGHQSRRPRMCPCKP